MRRVAGILILIIVLFLVIIYFLPSSIHIEKSMILKARSEVVYDQLNHPNAWQKWASWIKVDPMISLTYHGPESSEGAAMEWNSKVPEVETGNIIIRSSQPPTRVHATIDFSNMSSSENTFVLANTGNGTGITWTLDMNLVSNGFPKSWINRIKGLAWKNKLDSWMEKSLKNLDISTADVIYTPGPTINDTLVNRIDSLNRKVDSLKRQSAKRDTVFLP